MKRMSVLLALILTAGAAFAHDKGDLMLNIEPQIGMAFPTVLLMSDTGMLPGLDVALRGTVHYYFVDFFAINTGLGAGFNFHFFTGDGVGYFFGSYLTIPFGFRFSLKAFMAGAGIVGNIPLYVVGEYAYYGGYGDMTFKGKPYMGWYIDAGFDLSGRKEKKGGFGMFGRIGGSFNKEVAVPSSHYKGFDSGFRFLSVSLVFQVAIQVASFPIGKTAEEE